MKLHDMSALLRLDVNGASLSTTSYLCICKDYGDSTKLIVFHFNLQLTRSWQCSVHFTAREELR